MSRKKYDPKTEAHNHKGFSPTDRLMAFELAIQGSGAFPKAVDTHKLSKGKRPTQSSSKATKTKKVSKGWFK